MRTRHVATASFLLLGVSTFLPAAGCGSAPSGGTDPGATAQSTPAQPAAAATATPTFEEWRRTMAKLATPGDGCFTATHPDTTWVAAPCTKAPEVPYAPARGAHGENVGNGTDLAAEASAGTIAWAEGSFPIVSGVTSETDGSSNNYSLQLNTNPFFPATPCSGAKIPSSCQGWEQFIYTPGAAFIQYWMLNYNNSCPSGWNSYQNDCWKNIAQGVSVPSEAITNLANMTVTGTAGSSDSVTVTVGDGKAYKASQASVLDLSAGWTAAEFNVVGNANSSEAVFNQGASILVEIQTDVAGSFTPTAAPLCESEGFTGETNNLNLVADYCAGFTGSPPGLKFLESNAPRAPQYQEISSSQVAVLGSNGTLWLENGPFGTVPPSRSEIDASVQSFQAISSTQMLVLGTDGKLWMEHSPWGSAPPARGQVDGSVSKFASVDSNQVAVLGTDGKLWLETGPFTSGYASRAQVDGNVADFQPAGASQMVVLGTDGNLWLENAPFGSVPPSRSHIDGAVASFHMLDSNDVLVLGTNGNLWLEHGPFTSSFASRSQVDGSVAAFKGVNTSQIYVLGSDGNLWIESAPFGTVPPSRQHIDASVFSFSAVNDASDVLVLGMNGNLWFEHGPFTSGSYASRQEVDAKVAY